MPFPLLPTSQTTSPVTVRASSGAVARGTTSPFVFTFPGTPVVGDPVGIWITTDNSGQTITAPTGWTLEYSTDITNGSRHFIHKKYASGDGTSVSVTTSASFNMAYAIVVLDGSVHSDFGTIGTVTSRSSSSTTVTGLQTGSTSNPNLVVFHEKSTGGLTATVTPTTTTIQNQADTTAGGGATYVGSYDTSGGLADRTATYSAASSNAAGYQIPAALATGLTSVTSTRATTWNTAAAVTATRATTWNTTASVAATRATSWATRTTAQATRATTWTTLAAVATTRATTWTTRQAVTATRATTWTTFAAVAATRATSWATLTSAVATRATTWNTAASVASTRATTWATLAKVTPSTRATTWQTLTSASSTRATTWNVAGNLASVTATRATTWTVIANVSATRSTTWTTRAGVTTTRATQWSALGSTTGTRATTWTTKAQAASAKATSWSTLTPTSSTRATSWSVAAPVADIVIVSVVEFQRPFTMTGFQLAVDVVEYQRLFTITQEALLQLAPEGVEFYALTITTDPDVPAAQWQASFDGGTSWHVAEVVDGRSAWLVAGYAAADPGAAVAVLTSSTVPLVQHTDNPSVYVRYPPAITVH